MCTRGMNPPLPLPPSPFFQPCFSYCSFSLVTQSGVYGKSGGLASLNPLRLTRLTFHRKFISNIFSGTRKLTVILQIIIGYLCCLPVIDNLLR